MGYLADVSMRRVGALGVLIVAGLHVPEARAQEAREWFGMDVELGAAHGLDATTATDFGIGLTGSLGVELNLHALVGLHAGGNFMLLSSSASPRETTWTAVRAGARFHWGALIQPEGNDGWLDVHWNYGDSGGIARHGFDVGVGYAFSLIRLLRIGPFVRFHGSSDLDNADPYWLQFGVTVGILGDPRDDLGPRDDTDGDGIADADDRCPDRAAGARPDPARPGCPLLDHDADGIPDGEDLCPTEPAGARPDPARPGCPSRDSDGDGIQDASDHCPMTPAGAMPDPDRTGCPSTDRDGDTVPDAVDRCPDEPGAPSRDPSRNGCPGLVRVDSMQIHVLRPVFFATGRDTILEESFPVLMAVADAALAGEFRRIRIEGHTDSRGDDQSNMRLSQARAESVRRWLVQHDVPAARLEAVGFGETRPIESNDSDLGRAANRRVEFHIVEGAAE